MISIVEMISLCSKTRVYLLLSPPHATLYFLKLDTSKCLPSHVSVLDDGMSREVRLGFCGREALLNTKQMRFLVTRWC